MHLTGTGQRDLPLAGKATQPVKTPFVCGIQHALGQQPQAVGKMMAQSAGEFRLLCLLWLL